MANPSANRAHISAAVEQVRAGTCPNRVFISVEDEVAHSAELPELEAGEPKGVEYATGSNGPLPNNMVRSVTGDIHLRHTKAI